jgi:hypothetical protein
LSLGHFRSAQERLVFSRLRRPRGRHIDLREQVPAADLEVVKSCGRDLDRAGAFSGRSIRGDGDVAPDQRQDDRAVDQVPVAFVLGMHRDGGVAEHRLRPRRRNGYVSVFMTSIGY